MQKIVTFKLENLETFRRVLVDLSVSMDELLIRLIELGYIKEVSIEDDYEAMVFAQIYLMYRRSLHQKNLTLITSTTPQWTLLKRVTQEALAYVEAFDYEMREGFVKYLEIAETIDAIPLQKLRYKQDIIIDTQKAEEEVDNDPNQMITDRLVEAFARESVTRTGYTPVIKTAKDYLPFIAAAKLCVEYKTTPMQYIQFLAEQWEWAGFVKPHQLHGKKAEEYLRDWDLTQVIRTKPVKKITLKKGAARYGDS